MGAIAYFIDEYQAIIGLVILGVMLVAFIVERFPAAVIALFGACTFLFLGILDSDSLLRVFSNPAPITIGAMFVLSGALLRTGTIDAIASRIVARAAKHPKLATFELFLGAFIASAFMNNTPVVLVLIPIMARLAEATGVSVRRLLIPLSYICIMGGMMTLIGTSTNLIVDAVAREEGLEAFGIFEITPYGLIAALAGAITLAVFGPMLLPEGRLVDIPFLSRLRVRILGITRHRTLPGPDLPSARMRAADRLLVTGSADAIRRMYENPNLLGVGQTRTREFRRDRAPIAIAALAGVVILAALNIVSIAVAAILAMGAILAARCIDAEEAWGSIDGNVLILIFAMLAVGLGLQRAGSVDLIVQTMVPLLFAAPEWSLIFVVYFLSVLLTEVVTNNAVAVIVTPIVIGLAAQLGVDPRPLVIAVMFAASASFATPIGYQTNTLVYAAGNYRFVHFLKAGLPLTFVVGLTTCCTIAFLFA
ncbi:MAG: SLC13 family permease [Sphingomonadales bacterium]|nr:SLC13 family permease [Sphingomonadales bacterium]